jgi:hypothetical protein
MLIQTYIIMLKHWPDGTSTILLASLISATLQFMFYWYFFQGCFIRKCQIYSNFSKLLYKLLSEWITNGKVEAITVKDVAPTEPVSVFSRIRISERQPQIGT